MTACIWCNVLDCINDVQYAINVDVGTPSTIGGNSIVYCSGQQQYSATSLRSTSYLWNIPPGFSTTSSTTSPTIQLQGGVLPTGSTASLALAVRCLDGTTSTLSKQITQSYSHPGAISEIQGDYAICGTTNNQFFVLPVDNTYQYRWRLIRSNGSIVRDWRYALTPEYLLLAGLQSGYYNLQAQAINGCGTSNLSETELYVKPLAQCPRSIVVNPSISVDSTTIANTNNSNKGFYSYYPSPASNEIAVDFLKDYSIAKVSIISLNGETVRSVHFLKESCGKLLCSDLVDGVYLLQISIDGRLFNERIQIRK